MSRGQEYVDPDTGWIFDKHIQRDTDEEQRARQTLASEFPSYFSREPGDQDERSNLQRKIMAFMQEQPPRRVHGVEYTVGFSWGLALRALRG